MGGTDPSQPRSFTVGRQRGEHKVRHGPRLGPLMQRFKAAPICTRQVALKMFREAYLPKIGTTTHSPRRLWDLFLDRMVDEGIITRRQARKWAPPRGIA